MILKKSGLTVVIAIGLVLAGCSIPRKGAVTAAETDVEAALAQKDDEINQLRSSLDEATHDLEREKVTAEQAEQSAAAAKRAEQAALETVAQLENDSDDRPASTIAQTGSALMPPNAKAGECYARVFVPPTYGKESVRVVKSEASQRLEVEPGKYEWAEEKVLVSEASERIEVAPATYKTVEERVVVKEASTQIEEVPAVYDWVEEKVLVEPAHKVWKKGRGPIEKVDDATGEIMCLVEVPDRYETVKKRVLESPATVRKVEIPAEYKVIKKQVIDKPATTRKVAIPATYDTLRVKKTVSPPQETRIDIPAEYGNVTKTVKRSEGKMVWRSVLCETNMSSATVRKIQLALKRAGHDPVMIDGVYGRLTENAVRSFQAAKGLATGGLTMATLSSLGVEPGS